MPEQRKRTRRSTSQANRRTTCCDRSSGSQPLLVRGLHHKRCKNRSGEHLKSTWIRKHTHHDQDRVRECEQRNHANQRSDELHSALDKRECNEQEKESPDDRNNIYRHGDFSVCFQFVLPSKLNAKDGLDTSQFRSLSQKRRGSNRPPRPHENTLAGTRYFLRRIPASRISPNPLSAMPSGSGTMAIPDWENL